jgi:DNA (cytosine-5)-methyltransferase 1
MKFGSVCSGIEAASVAWKELGWKAAWFSEIEPFPCAVLKHHYPNVPNHGDMTTLPDRILSGEVEAPDVFCGGTPCQAFSVAGNRKSLDDARGNLSLTFCEIANAIDSVRQQRNELPVIIFWENVPGVLNTKDNAFGCFLAELAGETVPLQPSGGRWTDAGVVLGPKRAIAWRVCDAQYFGLAQRRRRVFVVASAREGFNSAEILFEFDSLRRDSAPSREARKGIAADAQTGVVTGGGIPEVAGTLMARDKKGVNTFDMEEGKYAICAEVSPTVTNGQPFSRTGNERVECDALVVSQHGEIAGTITARHDSSPCADRGMNVVAVPSPPPCVQDSRRLRRRRC